MKTKLPSCNSIEHACSIIDTLGFLPFFGNEIDNFSIEEFTPDRYWFSSELDGPWEWKGPIIEKTNCAYGKFFHNKAGFISKKWYADFSNYRRDGYDFDAGINDGINKVKDMYVYDTLNRYPSLLSGALRQLCGFTGKQRHQIDVILTRLQMTGYVLISDFEYKKTRQGTPYGWGVARYSTPERVFGNSYVKTMYSRDPKQSYQRMFKHLKQVLPQASEDQITRFLD